MNLEKQKDKFRGERMENRIYEKLGKQGNNTHILIIMIYPFPMVNPSHPIDILFLIL